MKNSTISFILMLLVCVLVGSTLGWFVREQLHFTELQTAITCGGAGAIIGICWPKIKDE